MKLRAVTTRWIAKEIEVYSLKLVVGKGSGYPGRRRVGLQAPHAHRLVRRLSRKTVLPNLDQPGGHPAPLSRGWPSLLSLGKLAPPL